MNNFERGLDPKESMELGVDARLKELGCRFTHTRLGEPIFVKGEDPDTTISVRPLNWNSKQLRAMADYLDAHPDATKVIDLIEDDNPSRLLEGMTKYAQAHLKKGPIPAEPDMDIDLDALDFPMPALPPSKFGN
jgi:hypothetical protein